MGIPNSMSMLYNTSLLTEVYKQLMYRRMVSSGFLQEPHGVTTQKTPFFIVTAMKTSNLTADVLSHCIPIFFLQYLMNAENQISS
jgi:hypothetical protein